MYCHEHATLARGHFQVVDLNATVNSNGMILPATDDKYNPCKICKCLRPFGANRQTSHEASESPGEERSQKPMAASKTAMEQGKKEEEGCQVS